MRRGMIGALALALAAACGPPPDVKKVRSSVYDTDFATVWNAVAAEMHDRFHDDGIRVEDPSQAVIISKWKSVPTLVSREAASSEELYQVGPRTAGGPRNIGIGGDMIQIRVRIAPAGPPWHVIVDGEGAHKSPESPVLRPYPRGGDGEPPWIQGRIDLVKAGIYERLQKYAVTMGPDPMPH